MRSARPRRAVDTGRWPAPLANEPVHATVRVPGSKSETNRALVLAALADGPSRITGGLDARDTRLMRAGLRTLGVRIDDDGDSWQVTPPANGFVGSGEIDCGLAGTVMRFLPAVAALGTGEVRFTGDEEALRRPMGPLLDALSDMGAGVEADGDTLPVRIAGRTNLPGGPINLDSSTSSQYLSAVLLVGARCADGLDVRHVGGTLPSRPHVQMTVEMLRQRGVRIEQPEPDRWVVHPGPIAARDSVVEPDLSNAAAFLAAALITQGQVTVPDWPERTNQPGDLARDVFAAFGASVERTADGLVVRGGRRLNGVDLDLSAASELTPVVAALAAVAHDTSHLRGIGHIRGHETDRLAALEAELNNLGSHTRQTEDGLVIHPRVLHGGEWHTYADHRMAHAGALLGLLVDDVTLDEIGCTSKTLPEFPLLWAQMLSDSDDWSDGRREGV
ncbi:3-phosphoshikimate 1-carboxyvinyltransferase [Enemella dayhoffiae]|uniref:3-phosphoshikimate 1-carboxyvinyltransferase n=1 Tax=Enemella dayhoffiae TaxID=2016507 RepID=A0A255GUV1_9ACTN|nr:3-phosphoshikimate 1-carboxyvinyltransferase [Enemella dayhoffiae]